MSKRVLRNLDIKTFLHLPISRETSCPKGVSFLLRASPICRTISPLFGAGSSTQVLQAEMLASTQDL